VILTHGQWHHVGGLAALREPGTTVLAQAGFPSELERSRLYHPPPFNARAAQRRFDRSPGITPRPPAACSALAWPTAAPPLAASGDARQGKGFCALWERQRRGMPIAKERRNHAGYTHDHDASSRQFVATLSGFAEA
jgi:hypothetical protein